MENIKQLTKDQIADFRDAFSLFKADAEGTIRAQDLGEVLHSLGKKYTDTDLDDIVREIDVDGSGDIEFPEFIIILCYKANALNLE